MNGRGHEIVIRENYRNYHEDAEKVAEDMESEIEPHVLS